MRVEDPPVGLTATKWKLRDSRSQLIGSKLMAVSGDEQSNSINWCREETNVDRSLSPWGLHQKHHYNRFSGLHVTASGLRHMKKHILTSFFVDFVRGKTPLRVIVALNCRRGAPLGLYRHQSRALCVMGWCGVSRMRKQLLRVFIRSGLILFGCRPWLDWLMCRPFTAAGHFFFFFLLKNDFKEISSDVLTRSVLYLSHRLPKKLMTLSVNFLIGWPVTVCCSACPAVYVLFSFSGRSSTAQPLASYRFELNILLLPLAVPLGDVSVSKREKHHECMWRT